MGGAVIHSFWSALAKSHLDANAPFWVEVYRRAFPNLAGCHATEAGGWAQKAGIDRVLVLKSGKTVTVEEKLRDRDWPDFCLEYWSDRDTRQVGWVCQDMGCDFVAYAFVPSRTCHFLPFVPLREAWRQHGRDWVARYPRVEAETHRYSGGTYRSVSVAVPIPIVKSAIADAMTVTWEAE